MFKTTEQGKLTRTPKSIALLFGSGYLRRYGGIRPSRKPSQILALFIAMNGIMFTGIIVAITISTATQAFNNHESVSSYQEHVTQTPVQLTFK